MKSFKDRVAVITGGASGIGRAMAERFAAAGMKIELADVEPGALNRAAREMRAAGHRVLAVRTDVSKAASVAALARKAMAAFGGVHLLCNNAGVYPPDRYSPVWEAPLEDWQWAFDVNLYGIVHGIRAFMPLMLASGAEGHVVNTASLAGIISGSGSAVYGASKHAVVRLSEAMYASLREQRAKIDVSVLCPGMVQTGIYRSQRNRPGKLRGVGVPAKYRSLGEIPMQNAMAPAEVAEQVFNAVRRRQFYVITTTSFDDTIRDRMESILARRNPVFPNIRSLSRRDSKAV
ncbi:MAG: SDR family NAD(P)-dependent oxidoreductase [Betaproteobacteria bacterium]|nr:SDR family NAD(P)-dependent oxidoreductase [Betaproteobacteria bacterium]